MTAAVIMAGGQSARMRATAGRHKGLVPVLGVPLLERNLCTLLSEGFRDITVTMRTGEPDLERYVAGRGRALAAARNARLESLVETSPLGTIGAVAHLAPSSRSVLVVNVDNLTALPLAELAAFHETAGAAMTIASHADVVRVPCGELAVVDGHVTAYLEKPGKPFVASSGTYVLGARARSLLDGGRCDIPELVTALIARGEGVRAFPHDAPWIDVNDAALVRRAELLVAGHPERFEHWKESPAAEVAALVLRSATRMLVVRRPAAADRYRDLWDVPGERLGRDDAIPFDGVDRLLGYLRAAADVKPELVASFDDLDVTGGRLIRHHVFVADVADEPRGLVPDAATQWVDRARVAELPSASAPLMRALGWAATRR